MPGMTHWQSPRYFAYFATTGSEPGILAELLVAGAQPGRDPLADLSRAAGAGGGDARLARRPARSPGGAARAHRGHGLDAGSSPRSRPRAPRHPDRRVVVCSEHTHSSTAKAARLLELELRTVPADEAFALRPDLLDLTDACARRRDDRDDLVDRGRPGRRRSPTAARTAGVWLHVDAAYAGAAAVCPELRTAVRRLGARRLDRRQPAQVALHADGLLGVLHAPPGRPAPTRSASSPSTCGSSEDVVSLSEYALPLGRRFRALKLWAVLRCFGREGLQAMIREHVRLAALFEAWVEAEPGWEVVRAAPLLARLLPARGHRRGERGAARARQRDAARSSSRTRGSTAASCSASRSGTRGRRRPTSRSRGTSCAAKPPSGDSPQGSSEAPQELEHALGALDDEVRSLEQRRAAPRPSRRRPAPRRSSSSRPAEGVEVGCVVAGVEASTDGRARDERAHRGALVGRDGRAHLEHHPAPARDEPRLLGSSRRLARGRRGRLPRRPPGGSGTRR